MINIKRIFIDGFTNIDKCELKIEKITALLSTNNYGKSNVLKAIDFGFKFITQPSSEKKRMMSVRTVFPMDKVNYGKCFSFGLDFSITLGENKEYDVCYQYDFDWPSNDKDEKITYESLRVKNVLDSKYTSYIERNNDSALYKSSISSRCDKEIEIGSYELIVNKLMAFDNLFYNNLIKELNSITFYLDSHLSTDNLFQMPVIMKKNNIVLTPFSNNDIARILYHLKDKYPLKYKLILNTMKDLFPNISDIMIHEINMRHDGKIPNLDDAPFEFVDYLYSIYVKDKNLVTTINISSMSDGVRRVLSLLTYMILADINNIPLIAIEEPENSIHPSLFRKYIEIIDGFLENSKVIISSHSPFLVNYLNLDNLYIGYPNKQGVARFKKIKSTAVNKINRYASDMGLLSGEYIFSLLSDGDEFDIKNLRSFLDVGKK